MSYIKPILQVFGAILIVLFFSNATKDAALKREYYEIKIYTINGPEQEAKVDQYLEKAYLPALHRAGIAKVGVYKPIKTDTT